MKYPFQISMLGFLFLLSSCATKKPSEPKFQSATPEEVGMRSDSLSQIDDLVKTYIDAGKFTGAVTLVAKNGKIIYESEVGSSDSLGLVPYSKASIFRMASMTKPFTSVAAMQLIEAGKLSLDDPVSRYIPSFSTPEVLTQFNAEDTTWESRSANREATVRHLLTQTAGVPYGFMNPPINGAILGKHEIPDLATYQDVLLEDKMNTLGDLPLIHDPGEMWMYGLNTDVLGRVVEVASGQTLGAYIKENISTPLGIENLDFFLNESQSSNLVDVYVSNGRGQIQYLLPQEPVYHPDYPSYGAKKYFSGGSGLSGTARDYFLFCQAMLNDGKLGDAKILEPETAQSMHVNQIDTISYPWGPFTFGFGFDVAQGHPARPNGTYSWGGAFSTVFWIDPVNDLIVIQLRQVLFSPDGNQLNSELEKVIYNSLIPQS